MSLSEYVELITANRNNQTYDDGKLQVELKRLEEKVSFYESDLLRKAYKKHKGEVIDYVSVSGDEKSISINRIEDIFVVILDSIKLDWLCLRTLQKMRLLIRLRLNVVQGLLLLVPMRANLPIRLDFVFSLGCYFQLGYSQFSL